MHTSNDVSCRSKESHLDVPWLFKMIISKFNLPYLVALQYAPLSFSSVILSVIVSGTR